jgi:predicted lactoylglutathione lyase
MNRMIFPNLPVTDLPATVAFWKGLGFDFNADFSNDDAACLVVNDQAFVMLLRADYFHSFHATTPHTGTEVMLGVSAASREEVDELVTRAVAGGAELLGEPKGDGPMYGGAFRDLDGHVWEVLWMDTGAG